MALKVHLPLHGSQPCSGEGAFVPQGSYEPVMQGDPSLTGHSEES